MPKDSPSAAPSRATIFAARLRSALVLWVLATAGILFHSDWLFLLLIGGLGLLALLECLKMFGVSPGDRYFLWTMLISVSYLGTTFHHCQTHPAPERAAFAHLDLFFACLHILGLFTVTLTRSLDGEATLKRLIGSFFGFFYVIVLFNFLSRILYWPAENGAYYALYLLVATKFTDMGAYAIGSLMGKHKLIPHISPGKTWEGFAGAFLGSYAGSAAIYFPLQHKLTLFHLTHILVLPLIIGLAAIVGDLAESVLKRCLNLKDSGNILAGIGGALDLIDSLCFTAPIFYLYLIYGIGFPP